MNGQRNERENGLDYEEQLVNKNGDQDVDRIIVENVNRIQTVVSNRF